MANRADSSTEKLIEEVKRHRELYDMSSPEYKNVRLKNKIWDDIAKEMGGYTGEELKKRWKNLRDCFSKHLRAEKIRTGQAAVSFSRYKTWPWAQQMVFFRPFLHHAPTESNVFATDCETESRTEPRTEPKTEPRTEPSTESRTEPLESEIETSNSQNEHENFMAEKNMGQKRKRSDVATDNSSNIDKVLNYLDKKHCNEQKDSIDLTFQAYAASVKKLTIRRQTMVKYKIAKLIMKEELAQQLESEKENQPASV
ncbi:uncharacterized protein LOC123307339 [Coccinella septempunctata]|uniref:uncharacterized protein LOC123307339 n=1 Tax=Coccinella septempunctata TaxID=41139 RepID=UPI001D0865A6|nr:uncharacterized protein LOC123307339 [Coccinella septempunctata]